MTTGPPTTFREPAFRLSSKIINHLINNWGPHENKVLYSINIPMIEELLHKDGLKIYWTSVWRNNYGWLFVKVPGLADNGASGVIEEGTVQATDAAVRPGGGNSQELAQEGSLTFRFEPDLSRLLENTAAPEGSDGWALDVGAVSVTPYLTSFAELPESEHSFSCLQDREWKL